MKKFEDLDFIKLDFPMDGVGAKIMFRNGFGVSVVSHSFSYGGKEGLYELAVLDVNGEITYDTYITNNVIGHLSSEEVSKKMGFVQRLYCPE